MARFLGFEGVDAVLFDCDGVLVDSEPVSEAAWVATAEEFGLDIDDFASWIGTTDRAVAEFFAPLAEVEADRMLDRASVNFKAILEEDGVEVFPDARDALIRAMAGDLAVAIVTNSERWRLEAILEAAGFTEGVDIMVASTDVAHPKPDPDVYLLAAQLLDVDPSRCVVIEDSPVGVAAARAAGMRVIAIDRGVFSTESLAPATRVVSELVDVPEA